MLLIIKDFPVLLALICTFTSMLYSYYHIIEYVIQYSIAQILINNTNIFLSLCTINHELINIFKICQLKSLYENAKYNT